MLSQQNFGFEPYLENLIDKDFRCLCSFRISTHRLRIERGRYCGQKSEDRLCDSCNAVENKIHFLGECKKYDQLRLEMFDSINDSDFVLGIDH